MKLIFLVLLLAGTKSVHAQFSSNQWQLINWFAGADVVATSGDSKADLESDFYVREFEFSAFSTIDQTFDGILTLAYHHELESGEDHMEIHEAYLFSSKIFDLTNIKIGKFFLGFGRLNRFHRHDWDFTDAPFVQKSFFGNEGVKDTGIEYKRLFPDASMFLTMGLTSGNSFNHTAEHDHHDEGEEAMVEKAKAPTFYWKLSHFLEFTTTRGIDVGVNYIQRKDAESTEFKYAGFDLIYKNRVGKVLETLIQSELWQRETKHAGEADPHLDLGAYAYFQKAFDQRHSFGFRLDYFKAHSDKEEDVGGDHEHSQIDGMTVEDSLTAVSLSYIYTNSEFMRIRLTLDHGNGIHVEDDPDVTSYFKGIMQFVFNIGAHPAHVY